MISSACSLLSLVSKDPSITCNKSFKVPCFKTSNSIPNVQYGIGDKPKDEKMAVSLKPITCTFAKIGDAVVLDPNLDEEKVMSARLTISHDENGVMRAMQKGKNGAFTVTEVKEAVIKAREKDNIIRKAVEESLK